MTQTRALHYNKTIIGGLIEPEVSVRLRHRDSICLMGDDNCV